MLLFWLKTYRYDGFLTSKHWQKARLKALKRFRYRCATCNAKEHLEVHHRDYGGIDIKHSFRRIKPLIDQDNLTVLCKHCHNVIHANVKLKGSK